MKLIYLLIIYVIISPLTSHAQYFSVDTIKDESPYNKQVSFIFPRLKNTSSHAADLINKDMVKDVLDMELGHQKRSIFENIWGTQDRDMASVSDISFDVKNNDADFFCIGISATACGAYCEEWTRYYTRESSTGKEIQLAELFSRDGLQSLLDSVTAMKSRRIADHLAKLRTGLKTKVLSDDDKSDYKMAIDLYPECEHTSPDASHIIYSLDRKHVIIHLDRCLPHVVRSLDEVDYTFSFDLSTIKMYLSDYGKSLLKL